VTPADTGQQGNSQETGSTTARRRERRKRSGRVNRETRLPWSELTEEEWNAVPIGSRRALSVSPGLCLTVERTDEGWAAHTRSRIPSRLLVGLWSAPRVRVESEDDGRRESFADAVARMAGAAR
jgi:hypothetical protein